MNNLIPCIFDAYCSAQLSLVDKLDEGEIKKIRRKYCDSPENRLECPREKSMNRELDAHYRQGLTTGNFERRKE